MSRVANSGQPFKIFYLLNTTDKGEKHRPRRAAFYRTPAGAEWRVFLFNRTSAKAEGFVIYSFLRTMIRKLFLAWGS